MVPGEDSTSTTKRMNTLRFFCWDDSVAPNVAPKLGGWQEKGVLLVACAASGTPLENAAGLMLVRPIYSIPSMLARKLPKSSTSCDAATISAGFVKHFVTGAVVAAL